MNISTAALAIALLTIVMTGCSSIHDEDGNLVCEGGSCESTSTPAAGRQYVRYQDFDQEVAGIPGLLPPNEQLHPEYHNLTPAQRRGLAGWHLLAGKGRFLQEISMASNGTINVLKFLDSRNRNTRFDQYGVFNDPGCRMNEEPDEFGLVLDDCDDPYSSGLLGLRLMPNPAFNQLAWNAVGKSDGAFGNRDRKYKIPGEPKKRYAWEVEPPYLPSLACTICHVSAHPLNPPQDPNNPQWDELAFTIGNQYFREGVFLGQDLPENEFARQVLYSQAPGTSDTSRVATDNIFNPSAINGIANLGIRPVFTEKVKSGIYNPDAYPCADKTGNCVDTYHVLKQGDDSSGPGGGIVRVFVNIGSCTDQLIEAAGGLFHGKQQQPIVRQRLHDECAEYQDAEARVEDILNFLSYTGPYKLKDALIDGWPVSMRTDNTLMISDPVIQNRGKLAFAENCATCHSSIQPDDPNYDTRDPETWFTIARNDFFSAAVMEPDFVRMNFLSDDRRYPGIVIGTHAARAMATNAHRGHIWAEYSSQQYQDLPLLTNGGYYRTPSLVNLWTSAPFLHNNELGLYNGRVDVEGRLEAFNDAMDKLLNPQRRNGKIRATNRSSKVSDAINLGVVKLSLPLPQGALIDKWANKKADKATQNLIAANDYKVDQGHEFGAHLSDEDKNALIEYLKTF
jgi:hypothetical protein